MLGPTTKMANSESNAGTAADYPEGNPPRGRNQWQLGDFELGPKIGEGTFGRVHLARELQTKYIVVIKIIDKSDAADLGTQGQIRREIECQSQLRHKNIVRVYGYFFDRRNIYVILEYCHGGSLYDLYAKAKRFSERTSAKYIFDIAKALLYCHAKHVIHRDIKMENILLDSFHDIKICDFGLSVHTFTRGHIEHSRNTFCGSKDYLAPEVVGGSYDEKVDVWALGVLLFEFLVGRLPFSEEGQRDTRNIHWPNQMSEDAKDLISSLLEVDPTKRLPLEKILTHNFVWRVLGNCGGD